MERQADRGPTHPGTGFYLQICSMDYLSVWRLTESFSGGWCNTVGFCTEGVIVPSSSFIFFLDTRQALSLRWQPRMCSKAWRSATNGPSSLLCHFATLNVSVSCVRAILFSFFFCRAYAGVPRFSTCYLSAAGRALTFCYSIAAVFDLQQADLPRNTANPAIR